MADALPRILIVDDSRMVRASLGKHLRNSYDIREEADGETGWQTLVLDPTVKLVISDLSMPKLDGYGLLERIRSSRLARIRRIPVLMISGEEAEEARQRARELGASDFITKGIGSAELQARAETLIRGADAEVALEESREKFVQDPRTGLYTRNYVEVQAAQALSHSLRHGGEVCALAIGFDHTQHIVERHGAAAMDQLLDRFGKLLAGRVRREDSLGHFEAMQFMIVSPGTSLAAGVHFASRLQTAIAGANIMLQGERLDLSVSVGLALSPVDQAPTAAAFLEMAAERMHRAMADGGNRIVGADGRIDPNEVPPDLEQALRLLASGKDASVRKHSRALARRIAPLLELLNYELQWQLPLQDMLSGLDKNTTRRVREVEDARE